MEERKMKVNSHNTMTQRKNHIGTTYYVKVRNNLSLRKNRYSVYNSSGCRYDPVVRHAGRPKCRLFKKLKFKIL